MDKIVKNASKGYGYNYASLSDIAEQGFEIPKMKTGTEDGEEYVYYWDKELSEWIRGAQVVIPDAKGMNKAQLYGSALTYARRYTTLLYLQLACGDDKKIEDIKADGTKKSDPKTISAENWKTLKSFYNKEQIEAMMKELGIAKGKDIPADYADAKIKEYMKSTKEEEKVFY